MTLTIKQMFTRKGKLIAGTSLLLFVAACGGSSGLSGINTLGAAFVKAFQTNANGTALADPASAGLVVNPNIDPFNV
ncbi:MAG TPA: hypothetical protein ENH56_18115 [Roseobacter sp.]|uniref:Uncharacterized protein n=1 Tax=marine sediment metagenome TaxID=412755 RepID=A0A0F9KTG4_9ZZZZ|nr:hypothetical protein [Roseobacter sp.]HEC70892.1 hypothetical protein [Roseobacter sp.]|tara:strand:- start:9844 stop:10074 length:231 start_codon:yes stop_codon:yes gene_type:complete